MEDILRVLNAYKVFGNGESEVKALNDLSFNVKKGEFVAIMGASGSGKSTLLNTIATIDKLTSGQIIINGFSISKLQGNDLAVFRRDYLGFIFQEYNLLENLTIEENIALPLNLKKMNVREIEEKIKNISVILGIDDQLKKFPNELSGGQRQRVACARAVVTEPSLILADEPTGALDSKNSRLLMKQFEMMNHNLNSTILMVTHDPEIGAYASRVLFLRDGKLYNELIKGNMSFNDFYHKILDISASLGGQDDVI